MLSRAELADAPSLPEVHTGFIRRRCRNPRCQGKLARSTGNKRRAFCCVGCRAAFYKNRCVVCEAELSPGPANRQICWRKKCRAELRKYPQTYQWSKSGERPPRSAHFTGLKTRAKGRPTWRVVAGPAATLDPINLAVPLSPETAARVRRANERAWVGTTKITTPSWPTILVGGSDYEHELVHWKRNSKPKQTGR
jgi:hypothetical protein